MATIPTARTWNAGEGTNKVMMDNLYDCQRFLFNTPSVSVYRAQTTNCPNNKRVQLAMTGAYQDNDRMFLDDTGNIVNAYQIQVKTPGMYEVEMSLLWGTGSANGPRFVGWIGLAKNNSNAWPAEGSANYVASDMVTGGGPSRSDFPICNRIYTVQPFIAGDYLNFFCKAVRDRAWTIPAGLNARWSCSVSMKWRGQ